MKQDFSEVVNFVRFRKVGQQGTKTFVKHKDKRFYEPRFMFADSTVFDVFHFPLVEGNPKTALSRPNTIVITQEMAQKYFGDENPIGKTLTADPYANGNLMDFEITGVLNNIPHNSHIHFDFLASFVSQRENLNQFAGFQPVFTYVQLKAGASPEKIDSQLPDFLHRHWTDDPWYTISLQPLLDIHLHSHLRSEIEPNGNIVYVYIFSLVAVFILIIAGINFMNLATARSAQRAREVGVRKAIGAHRSQLIRQFLSESLLISLISGLFALALIDLALPIFNNLTGKQITISYLHDPVLIGVFFGVLIVVGLLAGLYPALFLSSYKPIHTLKGTLKEKSSGGRLRKGLVIFQFTISIVMIVATGIAYHQLQYIQNKDLGYAKDQIMVIPLNNEVRNEYMALKNELLQNAHILNTTTSSLVPTMGSSHDIYSFEGVKNEQSLATYYIDKNFIDTYGIKLLAGKDISRDLTVNKKSADFLISQKAVKEAGWNSPGDALGRTVKYGEYQGQISGVVNNLFIYSLHEQLYAMIFFITPIKYHEYLSIKVDSRNVQQSIAYIQKTWKKLVPDYPLDYTFLDQSFERMHQADIRVGKTLSYFALLAIIVACLGLFGLAAFMAERKTKEIGIRKVLGATISNIILLLSRDFLKLIIVAVILATPLAWYFMHRWLQSFAYRIDISFMTFVWAGLIAIGIAVLTIGYQSIKAALTNPVESLRSE
jgi:putative ABC transport system permease protein